jgi:hypothetical protein
MVFEEHAKLEWRAPAIDGRVCRIWRQIILNTPRVWAYLEIGDDEQPRVGELRSWLGQSGAAPLHIRIDNDAMFYKHNNKRELYDLLRSYHTRVVSLRMAWGDPSLFEGREFPCMRLLDIRHWSWPRFPSPPVQWDLLPELRSLRLGIAEGFVAPLNGLAPLKRLALYNTTCTSLLRHSPSLTTLMLDEVYLGDVLSGPVAFPSLTYLSLYNVIGFKPYIHAPCLVTYHQGGDMRDESFSTPLPSLVEYGVYGINFGDQDFIAWHRSFPNLLRLSIRATPIALKSFLGSLSSHLQSLPVLCTICVGVTHWGIKVLEEDREIMESLVRVRSKVPHIDVSLYVEMRSPSQIPLFFGDVSRRPIIMICVF